MNVWPAWIFWLTLALGAGAYAGQVNGAYGESAPSNSHKLMFRAAKFPLWDFLWGGFTSNQQKNLVSFGSYVW